MQPSKHKQSIMKNEKEKAQHSISNTCIVLIPTIELRTIHPNRDSRYSCMDPHAPPTNAFSMGSALAVTIPEAPCAHSWHDSIAVDMRKACTGIKMPFALAFGTAAFNGALQWSRKPLLGMTNCTVLSSKGASAAWIKSSCF